VPPRTQDQILPILTTKDWSKNKGIIAKLVSETGIGAELKKLQDLWGKVQWDVILYDKATATGVKTDGPGLAKLFEAAKKAYPAVETVRKQLLVVEKQANDTAKKWKTNSKIPKSSVKHVEDLATAAKSEYMALKSLGDKWVNKIAERKRIDGQALDNAKSVIKPYLVKLRKECADLLENPKVDDYGVGAQTGFHQTVRGINAALARVATLKAWSDKNWKDLAQDGFVPKQDSEVKAKVNKVLEQAKELEKEIN